MALGDRVVARFKRAQMDALDYFIDKITDQFLDELAKARLLNEQTISAALLEKGVNADGVNQVAEGKTAGPFVRALGGFVAKGIWYTLIRPFQVLAKVFESPTFRAAIKADVRRAFRKEVRDTRHMIDVATRWMRGEEIHPMEFKAAKQHLLRIVARLILAYLSAPSVKGLFSAGLWKALQRLFVPIEELLILLLERPVRALMQRLLTTPV